MERLRRADREAAQRFGLDDMVAKLRRLIAGGALGANFNIVVPSDAEVIVEALQLALRGSVRRSLEHAQHDDGG